MQDMSVMPNIYENLKDDAERSALLISKIDEEITSYRVAVEKNEKSKSAKKLKLQVNNSEGRNFTILRKVTDFNWLKDNLQMDFPFSYVMNIILYLSGRREIVGRLQLM